MKDLFYSVVDDATKGLAKGETLLASFVGEESDFVRFNGGKVRQPSSVRQAYVELSLVEGLRRDAAAITLSGRPDEDRALVAKTLDELRTELAAQPEDPYLLYATEVRSSESERRGRMPRAEEMVRDVTELAKGIDLVGIMASGRIYRGFANSLGQKNWHALDNFLFDWSTVHGGDKAVKSSFAGTEWSRSELERRIEAAKAGLLHLSKPPKTVEPGTIRTYLAPAAMDALVRMLNWAGVSAKAQKTKQSCLQKLVDGEESLSPMIELTEASSEGLAPTFDELGFARPSETALVRGGKHAGSLVSPRTAKEYGLEANGANKDEEMQSIALAGGSLAEKDVLHALGTGVYVSNLWYLNFSDRSSCRITGMTRFASYWVEKGEIVAPMNVMRFDDSIYRILGSELEALTREVELAIDPSTYGQRSVETSRLPGALVRGLTYTL